MRYDSLAVNAAPIFASSDADSFSPAPHISEKFVSTPIPVMHALISCTAADSEPAAASASECVASPALIITAAKSIVSASICSPALRKAVVPPIPAAFSLTETASPGFNRPSSNPLHTETNAARRVKPAAGNFSSELYS